jgi:glucosamine--fructose-6-phosphate aminotransferase (isomerizing)
MVHQHYYTIDEILSQPTAWQAALTRTSAANFPNVGDYDHVIFTGCGSTYYLSLSAAALYQSLTGRPARATPGGELLLNPQTTLADGRTLLVAISRSGTTSETVKAVERFKEQRRGEVIAITNYETDLAEMADTAIIIPEGQEESVAQTRSFASMFVAATAFGLRMAGETNGMLAAMDALPEVGQRLLRNYGPLAREIGENLDYDRFYFLGSGIRYGLASEVNLKMKEMTLTHSEPFHFLEFRHGPMSMVNEKAVIIGLVSEKNFVHENAVLEEMRARGGRTLSVGESRVDVAFHSGIPEDARGVLYLPVLQLMAFYRSRAKGLNPDRPTNLTAVVTLDNI